MSVDEAVMSLYTGTGDKGVTTLKNAKYVPKDDDRIELLGTIDEMTSHIGLSKALLSNKEWVEEFERIQDNLMTIMAHIADPFNKAYKISQETVHLLEKAIDDVESLFERPHHFVKPGSNPLSAQLDITRTVTRRAERRMVSVNKKYGGNPQIKEYMNRLADYFYVLARYFDTREEMQSQKIVGEASMNDKAIIDTVIQKIGIISKLSLAQSKALISKLEEECSKKGLDAVIAICNPDGNPIAVHCMDDAFLASYEIAIAKAYTSVALKMPTLKVGQLAQPGETFYGVDKMNNGKITIIGGGIPLTYKGKIIGGLGISGGSGEVDHEMALLGQSLLEDILS